MSLPIPGTRVEFGRPLVSKSVISMPTPQPGDANSIIRTSQITQLNGLTGQLLSPALLATVGEINNINSKVLTVSALLLLREDASQNGSAIQDNNWDVYYNLTFDLDGGSTSEENSISNLYKLTVYFVYNQSENNPIDNFNLYNAEVLFLADSLEGVNPETHLKETITIESIRTVEAIVVNTDPKTSRGTVTTVQSGG